MNRDRSARVMQAQFTQAIKEPNEYFKYYMEENNARKWYILIRNFSGDKGEYEHGEYLVRMELPEDFPHNPPHFYFLTPNGLYGCETKVCISIGEFHKNDYRAVLGVKGFVSNLLSGLIGWETMGGGIEILHTTAQVKKRYALDSRAYNEENYLNILQKVNESYAAYSQKWDLSKLSPEMQELLK